MPRDIHTHIARPSAADYDPSATVTDTVPLPPPELRVVAIDKPGPGGASHLYAIDGPEWGGGFECRLQFQKGGVVEAGGINGITHEALIAVLLDRLGSFQAGPFPSEFNARARFHLERALEALHERTRERRKRGVEGRSAA